MHTSLIKSIEESLKKHWDLPALSDHKGSTYHYKDLARRVSKLHIFFEEIGLQRGDKIAICGKNSANWGITFLASITYGAVTVPILSDFKPDNIHNIINHSGASMFFVSDLVWENLSESLMPYLEIIVKIDDFSLLHSKCSKTFEIMDTLNKLFGKKYPKSFRAENISYFEENPEELSIINYTSGTTGFSKGVMLPYRCLHSNMEFMHKSFGELETGDTVVSILPAAHMYGFTFEFLYEIIKGCHVQFLTRTPTPKIILDVCAELKPKLIVAVPLVIEKIYKKTILPLINRPIVRTMLHIPVVDKKIRHRLNEELIKAFGGNFIEIVVGGAPLNKEIEHSFKKIGFPYAIGYGMTEFGPILSYQGRKETRLYSCGQAAVNMELRIDSPDQQNIVGEIQARGKNTLLGYYKNQEATELSFTPDGWFKTGDLGVIDKDGYLFIKGRSKSLIIGPSGQNIYPEEIESKINSSSYIIENIVVEAEGKVVALVYPDFELIDEEQKNVEDVMEEIRTLTNAELPKYSQIAKIKIHPEEFEKTAKRSIKRFMYQ